jgi:Ca-activated chloride channel family protein
MIDIFKINFAHQSAVYFLAMVLFIFLYILISHARKSRRVVLFLAGAQQEKKVLKGYQQWRRLLKYSLYFTSFFFLAVALLRPQWDLKNQIVEQEGRDILIALDISRSMLAEDLAPNRLEFAKEKIKKLLYNLSCDRVGLMIFSGATVMQCPLTTDYSTFFMFLDQLGTETISSNTTTLDSAVIKAIDVFRSMPERKSKIFCLFTDGEDFSDNLGRVKEVAHQEGISIFTIGIGTEHGAPIPVLNNMGVRIGLEKDEHGQIIMSQLNASILRELSDKSGGIYIQAVDSDTDIQELITHVERFETDQLESRKLNRLEEQYPYFVAVSFISLLLEWIL